MRFETKKFFDKSASTVRNAVAQVEASAEPLQEVRREAEEVIGETQACVRNFPMSAVFTAFAGGLIIGALLGRRFGPSISDKLISEPMERGRQAFSDAASVVGDALRDQIDRAQSTLRQVDTGVRRRTGRLQRMLRF